jgi:hypothetical protein
MQVTIDENSGNSGYGDVERFEELKLETGEVARFVILVPAATAEYVHELKPRMVVNGVIQMEPKQRKDKSTYEVYATGFKGRKICTGVVDIPNPEDPEHPLPGPMRTKGVDPENCIVCAAVVEMAIADMKAELRYAVPIVRITTRGKSSTDIMDPPSAKILVLPLTWRQYRDMATSLAGIRELYGWGPEQKIAPSMADLVIECEDAAYKRYKWRGVMRPHWKPEPGSGSKEVRNPALRAAISGLWGNPDNRPSPEQLTAACGKAGDPVFLQQDLNEVVESYALVKRIESGEAAPQRPADTAQAGSLTGELDGLDNIDEILGGDAPPAAAPQAAADSLEGLDEFGIGTTSNPSTGNGHAKPASPPTAPAAAPAEDLFDGATETAEPAVAKAAAPAAAATDQSFDEAWDEL